MPPKKAQKRRSRNVRGNGTVLPQELVNECLSYLTQPADLKAFALVCRSWSYAAQRALFREVVLLSATYPTRLCNRLAETLRSASHLVQYIRTLRLHRREVETGVFQKICNVSFTHLENVSVCDDRMTRRPAVALQRLFALPTLRSVKLQCQFSDPVDFIQLWNDCSPAIRHLDLRCWNSSYDSFQPNSSAHIALDSLKIEHVSHIQEWLEHDLCPFSFSLLAALSVVIDDSRGAVLDLSLFPTLVFLRIEINWRSCGNMALNILSTITASSRIRQIIFLCSVCRLVGLETSVRYYDSLALRFPRLKSKNLLFRADSDWFETQIRRIDAGVRYPDFAGGSRE
ncbi:hypothetical protein MVEN_01241200 [Mycena venus]|uniref:F-box domain-containing protein n=1 Tax=Mycena venus TaxID=2733690 RepID=A0A8H7CW64_9AGAR|nr:hypothetical protein MVEN_01241200 [Mycena venus]